MKLGLALVALVACVAALGCGQGTDGKACRVEAEELTRWLGTLDLEPRIFQLDRLALVSRADLADRRVVTAPTVTIGAEETTYQGQLASAPDELENRLTVSQRVITDDVQTGRYRGPQPPEPRRLHLLVDEAAPWERVVAVVAIAHRAGFTRPSFIFATPPGPSTRPPRTALDDRMEALDRDAAAGKLTPDRAPSEAILERCPTVTRLFAQLGAMETGDKAEVLVRGIGPALVNCTCKVDLAALRSMLWHLLDNRQPVRGLVMETSPEAPPIALPKTMAWREASTHLRPDVPRAWFVVAP
ncbi:MAG: hypothetical protein H0X17_02450 [Deltaproteobacteria bacterium]|nr:hypothetical protein [Deltaproteobacteria bacterium]